MAASASHVSSEEFQDRAHSALPDEEDQLHSAPNSEQNEEGYDLEFSSDGEGFVESEVRTNQNAGEEEDCRSPGNEADRIDLESDEDRQSGAHGDEDQGSSNAGSDDSETDSESSLGEEGHFLYRHGAVDVEEDLGDCEALDEFPISGPRAPDIKMIPAVGIPRDLSWVSEVVSKAPSLYKKGENMGAILKKLNRRGFLFDVDGMEEGEHAASWPGRLRFVMYDVVISDMNIRPPFTKLQQNVLAVLDIAPSQLHPNAWAFLRAFELVCLFLDRPVSHELFFHLFEVNRNKDEGYRHVSLRAKRNHKIFRPYAESVGGNWTELYYFVTPLNEKAISHVGKFGPDGSTLFSTKFPIGWRRTHYNRPPSYYHTKSDWLLSNDDKVTKTMLQLIEERIPFSNVKHKGIPTHRICKAVTKAEVQEVLGETRSLMPILTIGL